MKQFFTDCVNELHNVTWPTKKQATHSMILVMVIMLLVGFFLTFLDQGLTSLVESFILS